MQRGFNRGERKKTKKKNNVLAHLGKQNTKHPCLYHPHRPLGRCPHHRKRAWRRPLGRACPLGLTLAPSARKPVVEAPSPANQRQPPPRRRGNSPGKFPSMTDLQNVPQTLQRQRHHSPWPRREDSRTRLARPLGEPPTAGFIITNIVK